MGGLIGGIGELATLNDSARVRDDAIDLQYGRDTAVADAGMRGARDKGAFESGRQRIYGTSLAAKQRQAYTASGVDATQGTAAAVQADTAALSELDAQRASINAARDVWGYQQAKKQALADRDIKRRDSNNQYTGQLLGGVGKSVSGAMSLGLSLGGGG